jgi:uncharacterized protein (DUF1330 family)
MKTHYAIAMTIAGMVGGLAVGSLHAQTKAPVYYVAEIDVTDEAGYAKDYVPKAQALIKASGGRIIAIGGAGGGGKVTPFEGTPPSKRVVIQVWDSMDKIQAWRNSPDFKANRQIGDKYAKFRSFAVDGVAQ